MAKGSCRNGIGGIGIDVTLIGFWRFVSGEWIKDQCQNHYPSIAVDGLILSGGLGLARPTKLLTILIIPNYLEQVLKSLTLINNNSI